MTTSKLLLHGWDVEKFDNTYFTALMNYIYLVEIAKLFDEVVLLAPCRNLKNISDAKGYSIKDIVNISIYELPYRKGYVRSIRNFFYYVKAYKEIKDVTLYYSRFPTPFGWLPKYMAKNVKHIIHYVGDPANVAKNNPEFSKIKKKVLISLFSVEEWLYIKACKKARVYTNGIHLKKKLKGKGINAVSLLSSTISEDDFFLKIQYSLKT